MKYIKYLFLGSILFLTGCANSLKCNIKTDDYTSSIKIIFKDSVPCKYIFKDLKEFIIYENDINEYYNLKKDNYKDLGNNANIKMGKDYVSSTINYKFNSNKPNNTILIDENDNIVSTISKIESYGYKCQ